MKKLTGFHLKYLALVLMVLDHIHYMFDFTGKIPIWFSWLGRLSAPLFLFCLVEGFIHTHNRRKYFLKIYLIGAVMGLIQFVFYLNIGVRSDGFFPQNAMLSSFSVLLPILQGIDWCRRKKWLKGLSAILIPFAVIPALFYILFPLFVSTGNGQGSFIGSLLVLSFFPVHPMIMDGGTYTVLAGILLYSFSFCKNKNIRLIAWGIFSLVWNVGLMVLFGAALTPETLLFEAYQWMEILALIPMLCYNGKRGKGNGRFFYIFYPAHVYVLYALSYFMCR